jgi:cobalt-zinc-cadmium resistance protein CzcA
MERLVRGAMRARGQVLAVTLALLVVMAWFARELTLDALPDVTTNQVLVLTRAPGLTPEEVERLISRPVEAALGGAPGLNLQQRSLSRFGHQQR